jgi:valyl-tRNA synthetase
METLKDLIVAIRGKRKELGVPEKESTPARLTGRAHAKRAVSNHREFLHRLARINDIQIAEGPALQGPNVALSPEFEVEILYERQIDVAAERERLTKELAKYDKGLQAAEKQLGNPGFVAKAPPHIIDGLKKQAAETRALKEKAEAALAALPQ